MPKTIAGLPVTYLVRDDAADPSNTVSIVKKLITEDKVDVIIGPSNTATAASVLESINDAKVPSIATTPVVFDPQKFPWTFVIAQPTTLMVDAVVQHMKTHGVKSVGFIGFSDGWGDQVFNALKRHAEAGGIKVLSEERFGRTDTSVQGQVLKVMSTKPDAVMLGGSGTPGALPQITLADRGYKGPVYNNHGVVNADYIRVGGAKVEGGIAATGPLVVFDQLPAGHPVKPVAESFMTRYGEAFGPQNRNAFAGYSYDAYLLIEQAVPLALKKGQPGTPEFRAALRDALEATKNVVGTHGVYDMSPTNHNGMD